MLTLGIGAGMLQLFFHLSQLSCTQWSDHVEQTKEALQKTYKYDFILEFDKKMESVHDVVAVVGCFRW